MGSSTRRTAARVPAAALLTVISLLGGGCTAAGQSQPAATSVAPTTPAAATPSDALRSQIEFAFTVANLRTDHQFEGQRSTFAVTYAYAQNLQGAGYNPNGGPVDENTYPYFQDVRRELVDFVRTYPDKKDFYEVFVDKLARHLLLLHPQLTWIRIRVDVPGYAQVPDARTVIVRVDR